MGTVLQRTVPIRSFVPMDEKVVKLSQRVSAPTYEEELNGRRQKSLHRTLRTFTDRQGTHAKWEGREVVLFCGNDYLGLSCHPEVIQKTKQTLEKYGVGSGSARLISGTSDLHTELETRLAQFKAKESALVFGSGYLANLGVLGTLAREKDLIVMDKFSHASFIDGARLSGAQLRVFPHKNYSRCE